MRSCTACGTEKPLSEFWPNRRAPGGHYSTCKDCERERRKEYNARPEVKEARLAATRRWLQRNPGYSHRKEPPHHPDRVRARRAVGMAILRGKMQRRPCEVCGRKAHAHHDDYSRPLDVRWLCPLHHRHHHMGVLA
jgi:hypothetical protein